MRTFVKCNLEDLRTEIMVKINCSFE